MTIACKSIPNFCKSTSNRGWIIGETASWIGDFLIGFSRFSHNLSYRVVAVKWFLSAWMQVKLKFYEEYNTPTLYQVTFIVTFFFLEVISKILELIDESEKRKLGVVKTAILWNT